MAKIESLAGYDAVVLGSAIHDQAWLPEATRFVRENASALAGLPVWVFGVGMPGALPRVLRRWAMQEDPKVIADIEASIQPGVTGCSPASCDPTSFPRSPGSSSA